VVLGGIRRRIDVRSRYKIPKYLQLGFVYVYFFGELLFETSIWGFLFFFPNPS
jgi:hypothetical protein